MLLLGPTSPSALKASAALLIALALSAYAVAAFCAVGVALWVVNRTEKKKETEDKKYHVYSVEKDRVWKCDETRNFFMTNR